MAEERRVTVVDTPRRGINPLMWLIPLLLVLALVGYMMLNNGADNADTVAPGNVPAEQVPAGDAGTGTDTGTDGGAGTGTDTGTDGGSGSGGEQAP